MPDNEKIFEVHRLAQAAHSLAQGADHKADKAFDAISSHEKICSERYATINQNQGAMQAMLTSMQTSINSLNINTAEAAGKWKAISYISLGIGVLFTILKITGHA